MANKYSTLLNNLLKKARLEAAEKGRTEITFEDYLSQLFTILNNYKPPMKLVPGELRGILGVREELDSVIGKAGARSFDFDAIKKSFAKFDEEHSETRELRENLFSALLEFADSISPDERTTVDDLWSAMVAYPSASVKKYILGISDDTEEVGVPDPYTLWFNTVSAEGGNPEGDGKPSDSGEDDSGDDVGTGFDFFLDDVMDVLTDIAGNGTAPAGDDGKNTDDDDLTSILDDILAGGTGDNSPVTDKDGDGIRPGREAKNLADVMKKTVYVRNKLLENVLGQNAAIDNFISGFFRAEASALSGNPRKRPRATFLFAGPPGVGKTLLAEQVAEHTGLPYKRFDMSAFSDKEATIPFAGSDKVYRDGKPGLVTAYVKDHPRSVLLFDEIEKAHINVIYLFLQMLDAGRLRDTYTEEDVSFTDTIIILTTNAGRNLYLDPTVVNLSSLPRRRIIRALEDDKSEADPTMSVFPAALISRFASGNIVMFNHLEAYNLSNIASKELISAKDAFTEFSGIEFSIDPSLGNAILLAEGARSDARTVSSRARNFFYEEIYELLRLIGAGKNRDAVSGLKRITFKVTLPEHSAAKSLFVNETMPTVLVFGAEELMEKCRESLPDCKVVGASSIDAVRDILFENDVTLALCDVKYGMREGAENYLNLEDLSSLGIDFINYMKGKQDVPVFIIEEKSGSITGEELLSFENGGVRDVIALDSTGGFAHKVMDKCLAAYQQTSLIKLAKASKVLSYKTAQTVSEDGTSAEIHLFDLTLTLAPDAKDSASLLAVKPNIRFSDVIGAEDAKAELAYFVEYMKSPVRYMRRGLSAPKGVLLYGPPGTGKTLLAKAMAGESDVTYIATEGNAFLQRYVGQGARAVHDLFAMARKYAPSILFIDEIDAIAKNRASRSAEHTSDVLTAFLAEMDGFSTDTTKPVFVLAATNYNAMADTERSLDPALLRRFDRKLLVDLPNKEERARFIRLQAERNPVLSLTDEKIANLSVRSTGMSLAELSSVIELAMRNAVRSETLSVDDTAIDEAFETFNSGAERKWDADTVERTARHEAGHALLCWLSGEKPSYVTIVARADHGGYMQHGDGEGKSIYTKSEILGKIRTSLAGRATEIVYYGDDDGVSTGASSDLANATRLAENMVCRTGMDRAFGLAVLTPENMPYYYSEVRARVNSILSEEYENTLRIVEENRAAIDALACELVDKNHLGEKEIDDIFKATVKQ